MKSFVAFFANDLYDKIKRSILFQSWISYTKSLKYSIEKIRGSIPLLSLQNQKNEIQTSKNNALNHWLTETERIREINDDYSMSIECIWQDQLVPEEDHNSLFFSLAEWSTNITDLLSEKTYDNLRFTIQIIRRNYLDITQEFY